ncbi:hypothetical protein ACRYCC_07185 [Actinomadura scrupuli]|uniref:hypothetical protein n=1 Tax=Actinomadura scrupuli TaxID=559629 RepID=UPI003D988214
MQGAGVARSIFRRDRLTGQLAIGLVGVLCVGAVVFGVGLASAKYQVSNVGAWLSATGKGTLVHANGMAGKVDGKVRLPGTMYGHDIKIVQDGSTILIIDQQTGVVSRVDPAQLNLTKSTSAFAATGLQIVTGKGAAYAIDPAKATVQQIDPVTLSAMDGPATLTAPLGQAAIDGRGTLWVPVPAGGQVVPFQAGHQAPPVTVGKPKDALAITIAAGVPIVTNSTAATAMVLDPSGKRLTLALPSTVRQERRGGVLFPAATEGQIVPLLARATGSLVLLDTGSGRHSTVSLKFPKHHYGPPQILGSKIYIPDQTAGSLIVYDSATNAFDTQIVVGGRPGPLEVFVSGNLLWANDPHGRRAVVLDTSGAVKQISKYDEKVPGGPRRPIPTQGRPGNQGTPAGNGGKTPVSPQVPQSPQPTRTPEPWEPPAPPSNLRTAGDAGSMTVEFQPSIGGKPTEYVLKDVPAGMTVTPPSIAAGETPTFRVEGGRCGREYRFRVAVRYQDRSGRPAEVASAQSGPAMPCVPPGAPRSVQAVAESAGARVTWAAPLGSGSAPVTYRVSWTGPTTGARTGLTGTSVSLNEVWRNGQYTFTVTSANGAGAGQEAQTGAHLVGPSRQYAIQHNGSGSKAYVRVSPDTSSAIAGTIVDNGHTLTVNCQKMGAYFDRGVGDNFKGSLYDHISYNGFSGYMVGYLVATPKNPWQEYAGPPLWVCE